MIECTACKNGTVPCLHNVPLFKNLEGEQIRAVQQLIIQKDLAAGDVLFREGDIFSSLYLLRFGSVKLVRYGSEGREYVIDTLFAGDFYGGDQLFNESTARETGVVLSESGICMIRFSDLQRLILSNPQIALKVMSYLSGKLDQYRLSVEILSTKDVSKRLAMYLYERYQRTSKSVLLLSQQDIGNAIHLTQETVNRKLSVLQRDGLVAVEGKRTIIIKDPERLKLLAYW